MIDGWSRHRSYCALLIDHLNIDESRFRNQATIGTNETIDISLRYLKTHSWDPRRYRGHRLVPDSRRLHEAVSKTGWSVRHSVVLTPRIRLASPAVTNKRSVEYLPGDAFDGLVRTTT
ncbi:hypothetical protein [Halorubrum amylolyticum]